MMNKELVGPQTWREVLVYRWEAIKFAVELRRDKARRDLPHYADLRDGGNLPPDTLEALHLWGRIALVLLILAALLLIAEKALANIAHTALQYGAS